MPQYQVLAFKLRDDERIYINTNPRFMIGGKFPDERFDPSKARDSLVEKKYGMLLKFNEKDLHKFEAFDGFNPKRNYSIVQSAQVYDPRKNDRYLDEVDNHVSDFLQSYYRE